MAKEKILLAVSGGLDSMVMLHKLCAEEGPSQLAIAHCNFQLRGAESDEDESFVQKEAERVGVQFYSERFETKQYAKVNGFGIQEAARNLRYDFFLKLKNAHGYTCIATAHHIDDSIETFFINLLRGSGPEGLRGIVDDAQRSIIRPLLSWHRDEVLSYAQDHDIAWREDSSNASQTYTRNKIRHGLFPLLDEINPGWKKPMMRNMEIQNELSELLSAIAQNYRDACFEELEGTVYITLDGRAGEVMILGTLLTPYGFNYSQVKDILNSEESGTQVFSKEHVLTYHRDKLELKKISEGPKGKWPIEEGLDCSDVPFSLSIERLSELPDELDQGSQVAFIDAADLRFPLIVRPWKAGDRIRPLGMRGEKKVSDLLNDHGLSLEQKKSIYVLQSSNEILWVIGVRISEDYKVSSESKAILKMYI